MLSSILDITRNHKNGRHGSTIKDRLATKTKHLSFEWIFSLNIWSATLDGSITRNHHNDCYDCTIRGRDLDLQQKLEHN